MIAAIDKRTRLLRYNEEAARQNAAVNAGRPYQQCVLSLMDTISDPNISFDAKGISNYYYQYLDAEKTYVRKGAEGADALNKLITAIKQSGAGKKYDCITGVSGGVDSTYLSYMARQWGLNPLVVHFDNGWNSELAVKNIENIISKLGFDLYTLVVDWEEFKDIQLSYFKASVVDIEAITDHAIVATLHKLAHQYGIKYILSGNNIVTEATLPPYWIWNKADHVNLRDIHRKHGKVPMKTFPLFTTKVKKLSKMKGVEVVYPLNNIYYNKAEAKKTIIEQLEWRDYGGKHYESVFTRFYQGYILPVKFNIDKRKAHLSNLIFSGQIDKAHALEEIQKPIYEEEVFLSDYEFVLKKLEFTEAEFNQWLQEPRHEHSEYAVEQSVWDKYLLLRPFKKLRHSFSAKK